MSETPEGHPLTDKQEAFKREYLIDLNRTAAAIRAGYSARSAKQTAYELLTYPEYAHVQDAIAAAIANRANRLDIQADDVLRRLWAIANADPRELVEYRRTCCRYCHGNDFQYQFTAAEINRAREQWEAVNKDTPFREMGGIGYNATKPPHAACPECFGEGVERQFINDTRSLSSSAAQLYAGVKTSKDGIEVKMHDQKGALIDVGRHLGMFIDKKELLLPKGTGVLAIPVGTTPEAWAEMAQRQQEALTSRPAVAAEKET